MLIYYQTLSSDQNSAAVVTPATGKRIHLCSAGIENKGRTVITIKIDGDAKDYLRISASTKTSSKTGCITGGIDKSILLTAKATDIIDIHYEEV